MCGIVGVLGKSDVASRLIEALKRLEYRGYDSAGIAVLSAGEILRARAPGKLRNLEGVLASAPINGLCGLGHTRWATHGAATELNAHPHKSANVVLVHNGIIENFQRLKDELTAQGVIFESQTDTEIIAYLIERELSAGKTPAQAVSLVLKQLEGAFALAIMFRNQPNLLIGVRHGSPLAVGFGDGEIYLGSDALALASFTNRLTYLEEGDWAVLTRNGCIIHDREDRLVERAISFSQSSGALVDRGNHRHFMAKEIAEQPDAISHSLSEYIDFPHHRTRFPMLSAVDLTAIERVTIIGCGTAYYAGLTAKYWFEQIARLPVECDIASEFRYREAPLPPHSLNFFISQSGETADSLAALRYCKAQGSKTVAIVNVVESTIAREADIVIPIHAGPEIGVASTKAFSTQLAVLASLTLYAAKQRGLLTPEKEQNLIAMLMTIPRHMAEFLREEKAIDHVARLIASAKSVLFLGRGILYPLALEGALKLKELSYIHAEAYAAGELKHGPIALIDDHMPVVVLAPRDRLYKKTISNMEEVAARGGKIILVSDKQTIAENRIKIAQSIIVPAISDFISPLLYALPMQLLAYHTAVFLGTDVDQPRNLAKSVTVE